MTAPRPCSPVLACSRSRRMVGQPYPYVLGTGDYKPTPTSDTPWTQRDGMLGSDCAGFAISWCYELPRHRPGFNVGPWASVSDDINCNSAIEDAEHARDLFELVTGAPQNGDLLTYPTIRLPGHPTPFIGHVCIVIDANGWKPGSWASLVVAHCHGPNGRSPAVTIGDGAIWDRHDEVWPKPEHRSRLLRVKP